MIVFAHELFHLYETDKRDENSDTIPDVLIKVDQLARSFSRTVAKEAACYQVKQLILCWLTVDTWVNSYPADYVKNYLYCQLI